MGTRVSVIIPAYNAGPYIDRALASLENQTQKPDEVIVVDDGSVDDTGSRVVAFAKTSKLNILFEQQENRGPGAARNRGIKHSDGNLIAFLDADDIIYPDFLEAVTSGLSRHKHWIACFSDRDVVDINGNLISKDLDHPVFQTILKRELGDGYIELGDSALFSKMLHGSVIPMTIVCRRCDVEAISGFDEDILLGQDRLFMLKLIKRGTFGYVERALGIWQRHDMNLTHGSNSLRRFMYSDWILRKLLDDRRNLRLSPQELSDILTTQREMATKWIFAASDKHSRATLPLALRLLRERRISFDCFTRAIARYVARSLLP